MMEQVPLSVKDAEKFTESERNRVSDRPVLTKISKHGISLPGPRFTHFSFTKKNPWIKRLDNRARNKRAKAARRHNW